MCVVHAYVVCVGAKPNDETLLSFQTLHMSVGILYACVFSMYHAYKFYCVKFYVAVNYVMKFFFPFSLRYSFQTLR